MECSSLYWTFSGVSKSVLGSLSEIEKNWRPFSSLGKWSNFRNRSWHIFPSIDQFASLFLKHTASLYCQSLSSVFYKFPKQSQISCPRTFSQPELGSKVPDGGFSGLHSQLFIMFFGGYSNNAVVVLVFCLNNLRFPEDLMQFPVWELELTYSPIKLSTARNVQRVRPQQRGSPNITMALHKIEWRQTWASQ